MNIVSKLRTLSWSASSVLLVFALSPQASSQQVSQGTADQARAEIEAVLGFVPTFITSYPEAAIPGLWAQLRDFQLNPHTALSPKEKELIAVAVAAQVPCSYCTYSHTRFAKLQGATEEEIQEAVAVASLIRQSSTILNGSGLELDQWRLEVDRMIAAAEKQMAASKD